MQEKEIAKKYANKQQMMIEFQSIFIGMIIPQVLVNIL